MRLRQLLVLGTLVFQVAQCFAQTSQGVSVQGSCSRCRFNLTKVAAIGESNDEGAYFPAAASAVFQDHKGQFWFGFASDDPPQVYDAHGKALGKIARTGSGPGELRGSNVFMQGPGDSVFVADRRNNKIAVFTTDRRWRRDFQLP